MVEGWNCGDISRTDSGGGVSDTAAMNRYPRPLTDESPTPDGIGRFNHFQGGSIYWTPGIGAHEVHGAIRDKWASMG
jgi:uncharacterized protein with LGFP repeats